MRTLEIKKNDANQRIDKFLQKHFKTMPKTLMYKYIRKKCIKLNGKKCEISALLNEGDILTFYIKDEFFKAAEEKNYDFLKAPAKFDIVYEDEDILVLNKPADMPIHPSLNNYENTLANGVAAYYAV